MATFKPHGELGHYPNCADHLLRAGLTNKEAAEKADVSTSSVGRMKNGKPVLLTTISKVINMLNRLHFKGSLDLNSEAKRA